MTAVLSYGCVIFLFVVGRPAGAAANRAALSGGKKIMFVWGFVFEDRLNG